MRRSWESRMVDPKRYTSIHPIYNIILYTYNNKTQLIFIYILIFLKGQKAPADIHFDCHRQRWWRRVSKGGPTGGAGFCLCERVHSLCSGASQVYFDQFSSLLPLQSPHRSHIYYQKWKGKARRHGKLWYVHWRIYW